MMVIISVLVWPLSGTSMVDMAVGAPYDDDSGSDRGAVYVLFMNTNGTVTSSWQKHLLCGRAVIGSRRWESSNR